MALPVLSGLLNSKPSLEETNHEIFSMVILFLLLSHEGQLSVSAERLCTSIGLTTQRAKPVQEKCGKVN